MNDKSLCNDCTNFQCIYQYDIIRTKCEFYKPPIHIEEVYIKFTDSAGNYHWVGTQSGEHILRSELK